MKSIAYVEEAKRKLVKDVHRLARLGVHLVYFSKGGMTVHDKS